jgi:hypothetical protein
VPDEQKTNGRAQPGWYADPWQQAAWRWFDGSKWTGHISEQARSVRTSWPSGRRTAVLIASCWVVGTLVALITTLQSLSTDDFDGLNNMLQIPFALPWFLIPIPALTNNHVVDAWITAGMGLLNAALIYWWIDQRQPTS